MNNKPKVMIVDDDQANIDLFCVLFENEGFDVMSALGGADAIDVLHQNPDIKLVFLDVLMPEMDGYDTVRAIRKDPNIAHVPIVAVSGDFRDGVQQRCLHAGVDVFLPKPVQRSRLINEGHKWAQVNAKCSV